MITNLELYRRLDECDRRLAFRNGFCAAGFGIAWSLDSGRVDGETHLRVRGLSSVALYNLVCQCAAETRVVADVPAWLTAELSLYDYGMTGKREVRA